MIKVTSKKKEKCDTSMQKQDSNTIAAEKYISNCSMFDLEVDPSVVIALKTGWTTLQPSKRFGEGSMLPLMGILDDNSEIEKINLSSSGMRDPKYRSAGNGNANARALSSILEHNTTITDINLSNTGLDDTGLTEICNAIRNNKAITKLNLSNNPYFTDVGALLLQKSIADNNTLKELDLSRNALGYNAMKSLLCTCVDRSLIIQTSGNYVFEEIFNSVSHGIAFLISIVGAFLLISTSVEQQHTSDYHFWSCVLYSFSLMFLFLSSCLYHSFFMLPEYARILQILDHVGIYFLIAGSYTPFLLIGLNHHTACKILVIGQWVAAICGSIFAACSDLNNKITTLTELIFFLCMGLGLLLVWDKILLSMEPIAIILLLAGGALYLIGIIFFILGETWKPIYHAVWHIFVIVAAALHWFDIYFYVVTNPLQHHAAVPV